MSDLVRVWSTADPFEGELLRGRLEAEGVPVLLKGEGGGPYRTGPVYLFVPADEEIRARVLLEAISSGAYALPGDEGDEGDEDAEVADDAGDVAEPEAG